MVGAPAGGGPKRGDRAFRQRGGSLAAPPRAPASSRGCPRGSRPSSLLLVEARIDMVEEDAQRRSDRYGYKHAEDPGPAETCDEGGNDEDWRQAHRITHDLWIDQI